MNRAENRFATSDRAICQGGLVPDGPRVTAPAGSGLSPRLHGARQLWNSDSAPRGMQAARQISPPRCIAWNLSFPAFRAPPAELPLVLIARTGARRMSDRGAGVSIAALIAATPRMRARSSRGMIGDAPDASLLRVANLPHSVSLAGAEQKLLRRRRGGEISRVEMLASGRCGGAHYEFRVSPWRLSIEPRRGSPEKLWDAVKRRGRKTAARSSRRGSRTVGEFAVLFIRSPGEKRRSPSNGSARPPLRPFHTRGGYHEN